MCNFATFCKKYSQHVVRDDNSGLQGAVILSSRSSGLLHARLEIFRQLYCVCMPKCKAWWNSKLCKRRIGTARGFLSRIHLQAEASTRTHIRRYAGTQTHTRECTHIHTHHLYIEASIIRESICQNVFVLARSIFLLNIRMREIFSTSMQLKCILSELLFKRFICKQL